MKKSMLALILAAVLAGAGSASAATLSNLIHGNSCFNTTGFDGYNLVSGKASVPFNTATAKTWNVTIGPIWQNVWTYVTCNIPPSGPSGTSFLSTIYMTGTY